MSAYASGTYGQRHVGATDRDIEQLYMPSKNNITKLEAIQSLYSLAKEREDKNEAKLKASLKLVGDKEACVTKIKAALGIALLTPLAVAATSALVVVIALSIFIGYQFWLRADYQRQIEDIGVPIRIFQSAFGSVDLINKVSRGETNPAAAITVINIMTRDLSNSELRSYTDNLSKEEDGNTVYPFPTEDEIQKANSFTEQELLNKIFTSSVGLINQIAKDSFGS